MELIILGLIFFTVMPFSSFLQHCLDLPKPASIPISIFVLSGAALLFFDQITVMDEIIAKIISLKFLKEFIFLVFLLYSLVITVFATFYYLIAFICETDMSYFKWFYFSVITLTTVGYGDITPINYVMTLLASLECFIGYLSPSIVFTVGLGLILKENKI